MFERIPDSIRVNISLEELKEMGFPGVPSDLYVVSTDIDFVNKEEDKKRINDNETRDFEVRGLLSKSSCKTDDYDLSMSPDRGGSFLKIPKEFSIRTQEGEIRCEKNAKEEMALLRFRCSATSATEARKKFIRAVSPPLDYWSYIINAPLHISVIQAVDIKNRVGMYRFTPPYKIFALNPHEKQLSVRLLPVYALYREAKNSQSPYYKYLCYYKILEGVFNHLRPSFFKISRENGIKYESRKERIPDHPSISSEFYEQYHPSTSSKYYEQYIGKPIRVLYDTFFQPHFRDKVAHFFLKESSEILYVSDPETIDLFEIELPIIELSSKVVIETQEYYESLIQHM